MFTKAIIERQPIIIKTGRRPHMKSSIPLGMNAVSL